MKTIQQPPLPPKQNETSNPNAIIGFVIFYPFHYYIYKSTYRQLANQAEFIIDMNAFFPVEQPSGFLQEVCAFLEKERVPYRILNFGDINYREYMSAFFEKYQVLIGVWERGCLYHEKTLHLKKVTVTYGAGKEMTFVRPSQGIYDLALDYGKRSSALHSYFTNSIITGNAKFDDWFNDTVDPIAITDLRSQIDPRKKTLLYLPTHSDLSSIDMLASELGILSRSYNILTKLHYFTSREELWRVKLLRNEGFPLYGDDTDLLPLLKVSDVVLSDNSSAIFDAILADKPVIVADFWDEHFLDEAYSRKKENRLNISNILTFSESIEQKIKRDGSIITLDNPKNLSEKITEALTDNETMRKKREQLREELFSFNDGKCAERSAQAIIGLIQNPKKPGRPILYHAIEAFKKDINVISYEREQALLKKITKYESLIIKKTSDYSGKIFSIIFFLKGNDPDHFRSLQSLIEQNFSSNKYEIIVLIDEGINPTEMPMHRKNPSDDSPIIQILEREPGESYGESTSRAVSVSSGSIICLTSSEYITPNDWLLSFFTSYKKQPDIVGCGGFVFFKEKDITNNFYYREIAKKIGLGNEIYPSNITRLFSVKNDIPNQNPAGVLANTSYKKDCFSGLVLKNMNEVEMELVLRNNATSRGNLSFKPTWVTKIKNSDKKNFFFENIQYGYITSLSIYRHVTSEKNKYGNFLFLHIFTEPLSQYALHLSWSNLLLSITIFLAYFARWIGKILAILYVNIQRIKTKADDITKSSLIK